MANVGFGHAVVVASSVSLRRGRGMGATIARDEIAHFLEVAQVGVGCLAGNGAVGGSPIEDIQWHLRKSCHRLEKRREKLSYIG